MWEWSRSVAERALAATWQSWQPSEPTLTVVDPEFWADGAGDDESIDDAWAVLIGMLSHTR
ncbi:hypothetical protein ACFYTQ_19100 [Nocardia sp. NPDC004068]|uniref:hypothetical protein n=1 Tax=Nocardia sp. NPDC004068 TaxID=3364303 RepID=UPI0036A619C6